MQILCQQCNVFLVTDTKVHPVIKNKEVMRGDHYYCPVCKWECVADFGKPTGDVYLMKQLRENDPNTIDLDMNVFAKDEAIL